MVNRPDSKKARQKRHTRVRAKISGTAECPRLNVFRSLQHIYAQIIDDSVHYFKNGVRRNLSLLPRMAMYALPICALALGAAVFHRPGAR